MSASPIVAGARHAGTPTARLMARQGQKGAFMRNSALFFLTIAAASFAIAPNGVGAQSKADELPCVGYATFERDGPNTQLLGLAIGDVPGGAKVTMTCTGGECPFSTKSFSMQNDVKTLALTDMFRDPNLKPGIILELRVTKPGWIGKVFQYEIRSSADPRSTTQCLSADGSKTLACLKQVGKDTR